MGTSKISCPQIAQLVKVPIPTFPLRQIPAPRSHHRVFTLFQEFSLFFQGCLNPHVNLSTKLSPFSHVKNDVKLASKHSWIDEISEFRGWRWGIYKEEAHCSLLLTWFPGLSPSHTLIKLPRRFQNILSVPQIFSFLSEVWLHLIPKPFMEMGRVKRVECSLYTWNNS